MDIHGIIVLAYIIWLGLIALAILFCAADILRNQGDEPQRTLLWFTVITAFPVFGVLLYFFAGRSRTDSIGRKVALSADDFLSKIRPHENVFRYFSELKPYIRNGGSLSAEMLDRILPETRAIQGNHVELLRDGTAAYPQMLREIHNAKRSILLQSFIIADDEIGRDILKALEYKASTGIEVKILYDSFGSFFSAFYRMFNRFGRGIETFRIRPFSLMNSFTRWRIQMRNHRKLLVIDGEINAVEGRCMPYFDYFIWQAYSTSSDSGLNTYISTVIRNGSGYMEPEELIRKLYTTVNFEQYAAEGGGSYTGGINRLLGQALWKPTWEGKTYRKGGLGSYHIEYEYYLSGKSGFYPWTRQAINAVHRSENEEEVPNE